MASSSINYIDYDVLERGKNVYHEQADALTSIVSLLNSMNAELEDGWSNETARAFVDRMRTDHIPKLEKASIAIQEVSDYIASYMNNRQSEDREGGAAISG